MKAEESQVQTAEEGKVLTEKIHMNRTLNCKLDILVKTVTDFQIAKLYMSCAKGGIFVSKDSQFPLSPVLTRQ